MPHLQRVAASNPAEHPALRFTIDRINDFRANPWHGPVSDALGLAAGIHNRSTVTSDGHVRTYISYASRGPDLLHFAATKNLEAFLLTSRVVSSRLMAERHLPPLLRDFAAKAILAPHAGYGEPLEGFVPAEKRGRKQRTAWHRDVFIHQLASSLKRKFGISITENDERKKSARPSAMTIIEEASRRARNDDFGKVTRSTVKKVALQDYVSRAIEEAIDELGPWFADWIDKIPPTREI